MHPSLVEGALIRAIVDEVMSSDPAWQLGDVVTVQVEGAPHRVTLTRARWDAMTAEMRRRGHAAAAEVARSKALHAG